jgi:hypothetical protein
VVASQAAPVTHADIGFSDEDPATFSNPLFGLLQRRLGIKQARLIAAFDSTERTRRWLAAATSAGLSPYIALGGDDSCQNPPGVTPATGNCPPPSDAAYIAGFVAYVQAFPGVREWGAWNEPSTYRYYPCATPSGTPPPAPHGCGETRMTPAQAAAYWLDMRAEDSRLHRSDTIVAGDFGADCTKPTYNLCGGAGSAWSGYAPDYLAALGRARPAVWGTHSYHDLQLRPPLGQSQTNRFIQFLDAQAGGPTVWLTEEGAWLQGVAGGALNGNAPAQEQAAQEFLQLPLVPAARPGQIAREYYYQLKANPGPGFDSALLDAGGTPRPAYCVLVGAPAADCHGRTTHG